MERNGLLDGVREWSLLEYAPTPTHTTHTRQNAMRFALFVVASLQHSTHIATR
jgi:hypothetical protein